MKRPTKEILLGRIHLLWRLGVRKRKNPAQVRPAGFCIEDFVTLSGVEMRQNLTISRSGCRWRRKFNF